MITIEGREFPLWSQFVERKQEWIGGDLEEFPDTFCDGATTKITDISLRKNNEHGCIEFTIHGVNFSESFNVEYGGICGGEDLNSGWLRFSVVMCPGFRIRKPTPKAIQGEAVATGAQQAQECHQSSK